MPFTVRISKRAERELRNIDRRDRIRIAARIDQLASNPRPDDVKKLAGGEALYRIRVGDYRILYRIEDEELLVLVVRVGARGEVYRRLKGL